MSAVEQTSSSSGFWSSLFGSDKRHADKVKVYKPVAFKPAADQVLSANASSTNHSTTITANGNRPQFPAAAAAAPETSVGNGSTSTWKSSMKGTVQKITEPLRRQTLGKSEPVSNVSLTSHEEERNHQNIMSTSYEWTPVKASSALMPPSQIKKMSREWPPTPERHLQEASDCSESKSAVVGLRPVVRDAELPQNDAVDGVARRNNSQHRADNVDRQSTSVVMKEIENCLTDEWWDSLFSTYDNDGRDSTAEKKAPGHRTNSQSRIVVNGRTCDVTTNQNADKPVMIANTAAVLRLSSALQRAPASQETDATRPKKVLSPTLPKDPHRTVKNSILQEWMSDIENNNKGRPRTQQQQQQQQQHRTQGKDVTVGRVQDLSSVNGTDSVKIKLREAGDQNSNSNGPKPVIFEGIGPTDSETGVPIATRTSVNEANRKDWYKCMYKSLHKAERTPESFDLDEDSQQANITVPPASAEDASDGTPPTSDDEDDDEMSPDDEAPPTSAPRQAEVNPFVTAYILTEPNSPTTENANLNCQGSPKSVFDRRLQDTRRHSQDSTQFSYPPHARYKPQKYKNQPKKIEDYEPGCSSLAEKQAKTCESERLLEAVRCVASDADADYRCASGAEETASSNHCKQKARKAVRKLDDDTSFRKHWDQESRRRRAEIDRVIEAERKKRFENERKEIEAHKHSDFLSPAEKRKFLENRFDDDGFLQTPDNLQRPQYKAASRIRGKARASYSFKAQNNRELSLKKGDTVYLWRQVDQNWFKGEKDGFVGLFPVSYVEVLTSIEEAQVAAGLREGRAWAKYNFKGQNAKELSLRKGDVVKLIRRLDDDWYEARVGGRQGILPALCIELSKEPDAPLVTPVSSRANTPVLGDDTFGRISRASSVASFAGSDAPSRPTSPWTSDFYDSEVDTERRRSKSSPRRARDNMIKPAATSCCPTATSHSQTSKPAANYPYYRSQHVFANGLSYHWPTAATTSKASVDPGSSRDLFDLARRRRKSELESRRTWAEPVDLNAVKSYSLPRMKSTSESFDGSKKAAKKLDKPFLRATSASPLPGMTSLQAAVYGLQHQIEDLPTPVFERYRAVFAYNPSHVDELEIQEGDIVEVMEKCDDGWFVGTSLRNNEFGTFPGNYVEPLD